MVYLADSLIYIWREGEERPFQLGDLLGDLTDELESYGRGTSIKTFLSGGPKNYALELSVPESDGTTSSKIIRKLKGFNLKCADDGQASMQSLKELIDGLQREEVIDQPDQLVRAKNLDITTKDLKKRLHYTFDKRIREPNSYQTRPWGTVLEAEETYVKLPSDYVPWV
jgi:hypothetical protein